MDTVDTLWNEVLNFGEFVLGNLELVAFFILAAIAILAAIHVVTDKEVVHSAFYLALVFLCIGFVYFFLEAEFIGVVQILVYVGAITILFAFSIMLTRRYIMKKGGDSDE
ncbi:MAG: NADH-quinone oxidoreductase subunit J [Candidatus Methanomethylophilaceae archaeon]|nr:NADH-quinone oxidoreductase subunit J [Candidatus Methanomethylophilaceae archaeon]MBQ7405026.1 NADH-quinone oxidoreductase subunit J [Candidatus Methanomethylophilaceae archaeon]MBQ8643197.1 NADH-quinone oxidoreductase subunit J [Candidatus Methanomethylophilaceae archaeon]MBR2348658.1 NADH-quinone oxidoreductase subunit J [Candidatus Methanomethylophilaceae archaeon]